MEYLVGFAVLLVGGAMVLILRRLRPTGAAPLTADPTAVTSEAEERLDRTAHQLGQVLLRICSAIRKAETAAVDSTSALSAARAQIATLDLAAGGAELEQAQKVFLAEIDRVLGSNNALRQELDTAHETLKAQRHEVETLREAVRIDCLTGLPNRAHLNEKLLESCAQLRRYGEPFCLVMIDVDHFKPVNDTYGHLAGDRLLKGLAKKFKAGLRGTDFVARYGGEEFAAILPRTTLAAAEQVAGTLREAVEFTNFALDGQTVRITISLGVAEADAQDTPRSLVAKADAGLYAAKNAGRNRVCCAAAAAS